MDAHTRTLTLDGGEADAAAIDEAAQILRSGGLVAFATETVYGLGADATSPEAVAKIFVAKGRPSYNPLIVHAADIAMARSCVASWPEAANDLAQVFWPGPLTFVLPRSEIIHDLVTAGRGTVGVRIPALRVARSLISRVGRPLAAPSANRSNRISPTTAEHVRKDLDGRIDLILDSGPARVGLESTVLDLSGELPRILRPGPVTVREIRRVLGGIEILEPSSLDNPDRPSSPGQLPVHYAPRTKAIRVDGERLAEMEFPGPSALLSFERFTPPASPVFQRQANFRTPEEAASGLYGLLHEWDEEGFHQIVVVLPPDRPEWMAVRDRLVRATVVS
ncbi:MAG: Sua5/YciO/YrdC/YwlC family protein [Planctomycetota bacterium]|nr:Sua5/YciO/YrdC/YwlC family protein [Planctomycetota bacterium]